MKCSYSNSRISGFDWGVIKIYPISEQQSPFAPGPARMSLILTMTRRNDDHRTNQQLKSTGRHSETVVRTGVETKTLMISYAPKPNSLGEIGEKNEALECHGLGAQP